LEETRNYPAFGTYTSCRKGCVAEVAESARLCSNDMSESFVMDKY